MKHSEKLDAILSSFLDMVMDSVREPGTDGKGTDGLEAIRASQAARKAAQAAKAGQPPTPPSLND